MSEASSIQTIIQGGAVGIAVLMIIYSAWKDKVYNKTINNHFAHLSKALNEVAQVIGKNNEINNRTSKVLERVERRLDK